MRIPTRPIDKKHFLIAGLTASGLLVLINCLAIIPLLTQGEIAYALGIFIGCFLRGFVLTCIFYVIILIIRLCKGEGKSTYQTISEENHILTDSECQSIFLETINSLPKIKYEAMNLNFPEEYLNTYNIKCLQQAIYNVTKAEFDENEVKYYFAKWFSDEKKRQRIDDSDLFESSSCNYRK